MSNWTIEEFKALKDAGEWDSDACETPQWLFDLLDKHFNFFWDCCATSKNQKVKQGRYGQVLLCSDYDYLKSDLKGCAEWWDWPKPSDNRSLFINPPYSNPALFMEKAWEDAKHFRVVALVRDDPSEGWYQRLLKQVEGYDEAGYYNNLHTIHAQDMGADLITAIQNLDEELTIIRLPQRIRFEYRGRGLPFQSNFPHCLIIMQRF